MCIFISLLITQFFANAILTCRFSFPPVDLPDESTFKYNDIVPGGTITIRIWRQDGWGLLVAAAAGGDITQVDSIAFVNDGSALCKHCKRGIVKRFVY